MALASSEKRDTVSHTIAGNYRDARGSQEVGPVLSSYMKTLTNKHEMLNMPEYLGQKLNRSYKWQVACFSLPSCF